MWAGASRGGGGGGGSGLDYVIFPILLSEWGLVLITVDYGGGGGEKCQKFDNVICERPLTRNLMVRRPWIDNELFN